MKNHRIPISCFVALNFLLSSCGPRNPKDGQGKADTLTQERIRERVARISAPADELSIPPGPTGGVFRFNIDENPRSLDPSWIGDTASGFVGISLHEGLLQFHPQTGAVKPAVATHWEISEDGITYTFHLREGVFFHDNPCFPDGVGREVVAKDFKYSFERVCDPRVASPGAWMFLGFIEGAQEYRDGVSARTELARRAGGGTADPGSEDRFRRATDEELNGWAARPEEVMGLSCPDDRTFVIRLAFPFSPFLMRLGHSFSWVVPREAVEKYGDDFFKNPVGAGAFRFVEWVPGQRIVLEKHPKYWEKDSAGNSLPYLDGITIEQINNKNSEHYELLAGNLHFQFELPLDLWDSIFTPDLELTENYKRFQVQCADTWRVEYIGMLCTDPLFKDKRIRQAFNYAINRDEVASTVYRYRSIPNLGAIVPESISGYAPSEGPYRYDPEKALALLAEAGYPNGEGFPELELQLNSKGKENEQIAEIMQSYFADIGIQVRLKIADWRVHLDTVRDGKIPFFRMGWLNDYASAENSLMLLDGQNHPPHGENYTRYSNPEFDRLYREALAARDPAEQSRLFHEAEKIAAEDAPWVFLHFLRRFRLLQPEVRGLPLNAGDNRYVKYAWFATEG